MSAQAEGLLPLSQHALIVLPRLAYHDYEGIALNLDERERLVADLGEKHAMLLRNHGTLAVGETAGDCWTHMFYLERACKQQVMALSCGRENVLIAPQASQDEVKRQTSRGRRRSLGMARLSAPPRPREPGLRRLGLRASRPGFPFVGSGPDVRRRVTILEK